LIRGLIRAVVLPGYWCGANNNALVCQHIAVVVYITILCYTTGGQAGRYTTVCAVQDLHK
jgi:hypothetical protein